jgi:hypothetical protein
MLPTYRASSACNQAKSSAPALAALAEHAVDLTDERLEMIAKDIETTHTNAVLYIAARLAEARDIFRYRRDEGGFGGWVETRLHYTRSTAYNLLSIHERFGGEKNLSKRLDTFSASILYLLAAPSTPESARDEIIERAQAGESVSVAKAKCIVATAKGKRAGNAKAKKPPAERSVADKKRAAQLEQAFYKELDEQRAREAEEFKKRYPETPESRAETAQLMAELGVGEKEQLRARVAELENENAELKAANKTTNNIASHLADEPDGTPEEQFQRSLADTASNILAPAAHEIRAPVPFDLFERVMQASTAFSNVLQRLIALNTAPSAPSAVNDGLDIPPFLDRNQKRAAA